MARTITIEGTPDEVARLNLAQLSGRLTLALVGHGDTSVSAPVEIDHDALLGIERTVVEVEDAPEVCTITTNKGGERVITEIPCTTN